MADRVHPADSPRDPQKMPTNNPEADDAKAPPAPAAPKSSAGSSPPRPTSGTYVIQIPKDQIYRVPPPENAHLFESYSRRGSTRRRRRSPCCRCLAWTLLSLLSLLLLLVVAVAVLYFVFQPKFPSYSLERIAVNGFDLNLTAGALSPEFDVAVRADNPNKKIGISYEGGSDIGVYYSDVKLCEGSWPVFYQGHRNVTAFVTELRGSGIRLSSSLRSSLIEQQRRGQVPLEIDVKVPVRVKFGVVTSWKITVKVRCDVVVDELTASSKIVSRSCSTKVDI